jgi:uncharacterized protein YcaQ
MARSASSPYPPAVDTLSNAKARRIVFAAQGFGARRTAARSPWPRVAEVVDRLGMLQLDSVSVLVRAHYFPAFSRIGVYDRAALDAHAFAPTRRHFFEYWAHEASLLPLALHPLMRWRMARADKLIGIYGGLAKFAREEKAFVMGVRDAVAARGPVAASDFEATERRTSSWWGWNKTKAALEFLFWTGAITAASRRAFERVYDLTERVLPADILALPTPEPHDAIRGLAAIAGRALGVATETDIRDYFRLPVAEARRAVAELAEEGTLKRVEVENWRQPAFLFAGADMKGGAGISALVSPFDPLIWHRPRSERLFDLHYRIEIYVPAHKRQHGYYVLPFLHAGRFRARVDLKADKAAGLLAVKAAHLEPGFAAEPTAAALAAELQRVARWLDLGTVEVSRRGGFATELGRHF